MERSDANFMESVRHASECACLVVCACVCMLVRA